jgi:prepilin peptidase CpaA
MLELVALAVFAGLLIYAAGSDVTSYTIPNWVSLAMAGALPAFALALGMPLGQVGIQILFGVAILFVGFFLFQAKIIGGGDAKLLAATAMWTGSAAFIPFIFWTAVAGGVMAAALLAARQFVPQAQANPGFVNRLLTQHNGIPYGLAILVGGLMAIPTLPILTHPLTLP